MKSSWRNLGVVETIYEEEFEYSSSSTSPSLSPSLCSPPTTLHSRIEARSVEKGLKTDVLIRVQGTCFYLHKDPLTSRSSYLKRQLTDRTELTLSPPLNITPQTFSIIADFCYGAHITITPFNVAALRTAADLLQMTQSNGGGDENLKQITEAYFSRVVAINQEYALIVFRSCLTLLPEAETTAFLVSRCVEALSLTDGSYGVGNIFDDVVKLRAEDFKIVAESMNLRFMDHDVVYQIVDLYLKEQDGKITEEQKTQICNSIDCNKLSSQLLLNAVQNPRMPLRFIIRAMLTEQVSTRRSIYATTNHHSLIHQYHDNDDQDPVTLRALLQRDAALRQATQLKAEMNATSLRIQKLEYELSGMKKLLVETEKDMNRSRSVLDSGRSASFHYGKENNRIERGERGSVSSLNIRFSTGREEHRGVLVSSGSEGSCDQGTPRLINKKNIGQRLIFGLKSALRVSKDSKPGFDKGNLSKVDGDKVENHEDGDERNQEFFLAL